MPNEADPGTALCARAPSAGPRTCHPARGWTLVGQVPSATLEAPTATSAFRAHVPKSGPYGVLLSEFRIEQTEAALRSER